MKTYHIITIGCQMNKSDSERIAGYLNNLGYRRSDNKYQADLVIANTCGIRQSAEDRVYGIIPRIKKKNPTVKIILAGCLSERKDVQQRLKNNVDIWLPIKKLPKLNKVLGSKSVDFYNDDYLKIEPKYQSKFSAFVPIGNGCNNFCSYCVVPYARGREIYRPAVDILDEVKNLVAGGYKEIVLIAQNVNSYKYNANVVNDMQMLRIANDAKNNNIDFVQLLRMVNDIPGEFWVRFATSHPKDMSEELIKVLTKCKKVCEHIHLPVQSGDNEILKKMNRNYTARHYKNLVKKIKEAIPGVSITTDVIIGFPGETKKQFDNTIKLFKEIKFDIAYIARYSPRPGTAAEKLGDTVPREEKKKREEELMKVLRKTALENNKKYIGQTVEILVWGKNKRGKWLGRTRTNKNVKVRSKKLEVRSKKGLVGKFLRVKIIGAQDFGLEGIMIN